MIASASHVITALADNPCAGRIVAVCIHRPHTLARKMDTVHIESWAGLEPGWGMTKKLRSKTPARTTYRHGDLRRALLEADIALARAGGPDAVVLREATRRAGVVP